MGLSEEGKLPGMNKKEKGERVMDLLSIIKASTVVLWLTPTHTYAYVCMYVCSGVKGFLLALRSHLSLMSRTAQYDKRG